jgi:hypothetical protein
MIEEDSTQSGHSEVYRDEVTHTTTFSGFSLIEVISRPSDKGKSVVADTSYYLP